MAKHTASNGGGMTYYFIIVRSAPYFFVSGPQRCQRED